MSWFEEKQGDGCTRDAASADNDEEIIALLNARGSRRRDDGKQRRLSTKDTERYEAHCIDSYVLMAPSLLLLSLCTYIISSCRKGTFKQRLFSSILTLAIRKVNISGRAFLLLL